MLTCARPLESARFALDCVGNVSTLTAFLPAFAHFADWPFASVSSVVPLSTDTFRPQRLARFVTFGPPDDFSKNDVPGLEVVDEVDGLLAHLRCR